MNKERFFIVLILITRQLVAQSEILSDKQYPVVIVHQLRTSLSKRKLSCAAKYLANENSFYTLNTRPKNACNG